MELIASGRDADVRALDGERVLRRNRDGRGMDREASVMRHAAAHGYPVPRVYGTEPGAMVLERLYGPTMLASLLSGAMAVTAPGAMLGDLLVRLGSGCGGASGRAGPRRPARRRPRGSGRHARCAGRTPR